jgi:hypothetical protein
MQLPRGTLEKSHRGPGTLVSFTESLARENLTGYLRVSILSEHARECVVVYLAGKPVMAFVSGVKDDEPDPGLKAITASIQQADCIIEVCRLGEKQVVLLQELYGQFAYKEPLPPAKPAEKPVPWQSQQPPAKSPAPQARDRATTSPPSRFAKPEIRGRFVRSEELGDIREYPERYPGDTGHLLFITRQGGLQAEEQHAIISAGRIEAVYNDQSIVPNVPEWLYGVPGLAEFYSVEPAVLTSVLLRSLKGVPGISSAEPPAPARQTAMPQVTPSQPPYEPPQARPAVPEYRPAPAPAPEPASRPKNVGISAAAILEKSRPTEPVHVEDDITRTVDELSRSMDDDIAMVRKVEQDFALHADELLEKLDLGHLRKERRKL